MLVHAHSGKQYFQGPSPELGNKCPGQTLLPPLREATSSPSEELASGSRKLLVVWRLQVSISVDLASTFFARLSHCLRVSGRAWESQIFLISLELGKEKKTMCLEASWEWHRGITLPPPDTLSAGTSPSVSLPCGCGHRLPRTVWLKTTAIYSLTFLEPGGPR